AQRALDDRQAGVGRRLDPDRAGDVDGLRGDRQGVAGDVGDRVEDVIVGVAIARPRADVQDPELDAAMPQLAVVPARTPEDRWVADRSPRLDGLAGDDQLLACERLVLLGVGAVPGI